MGTNAQNNAAYGTQFVFVPATSPIDGGTRVTVNEFLSDINAGWSTLDTKAERVAVKDVLDQINQDAASSLLSAPVTP